LKNKSIYIVFYFLLFTFYLAQAQPNAIPDKAAIRIGEPIHVQLSSISATANDGFIFPDSVPHFDIWDKGQPKKSGDTLIQNITITSYDSGKFDFPEISLMGAANNAHTNSFSVDVQPVNIDSLKDYHDIKDILEVPPLPQWPYILGIGLITLLAAATFYYFLKKSSITQKKKTVFIPRGNPFERAMQSLEKLRETQAATNTQPSLFFTELTNIYRAYLAESRNWHSLQQTGDELILQAKPILNHELFFQFANTLRLADAAKFAKYNPPIEEWKTSLSVISDALKNLDMERWENQRSNEIKNKK